MTHVELPKRTRRDVEKLRELLRRRTSYTPTFVLSLFCLGLQVCDIHQQGIVDIIVPRPHRAEALCMDGRRLSVSPSVRTSS